jgi:hypothetical protein
MPGRRAHLLARAVSSARTDGSRAYPDTAADETLAATLISMWELASGRRLPRHVPPDQLSTEELIAFWADDLSRAVGRHAAQIPGYDQQTVLEDLLELAKDLPTPMLAFDVVGFTRPDRDQEVRRHIHKMLYEMLGEALEESGISQDRCYYTGRGDGPLLLVPPDIPAHRIINPFPGRLSESIRVYNKMSCPAAQIQVRAAAHLGIVYHDKHDLVSDDINLLFRMLDAKPLRADLERTGAGLALAISADMYDSLVRRQPALVGPGPFRHVRTRVKGTGINAWIHVPGATVGQGSAAVLARGLRAEEGAVMDPVVAAFGTALVGAIATDAWQQVREAVISLWRRVPPRREDDGIGAELDELREQVLVARRNGDAGTERTLEGAWQVRLQELLGADPALAVELQRVLDQVLTPALTPVGTILMTGSSHDSSTFTQIGSQDMVGELKREGFRIVHVSGNFDAADLGDLDDSDLTINLDWPDGPHDQEPEEAPDSKMTITIYLSDSAAHQQVEAAVEALLAVAGLQIESRDDPVVGSWFRRMLATSKKMTRSPAAREATLVAAHIADTRVVLAQDAAVTAALLQNLGGVLGALQPTKDAVIRAGALLIVKVDWVVNVFQLTAAQQAVLDHCPQLSRAPHEIVAALDLIPEDHHSEGPSARP